MSLDELINSVADAGLLPFFLFNALISCIPIPGPGTAVCIACGLLYGKFYGTIVYVASAAFGAGLQHVLGRTVLRPFILKMLSKERANKVTSLDKALTKEGPLLVVLLRLSPVMPFALTTLLLSLTSVGYVSHVLATIIGLTPPTFVYCFAAELGNKAASGEVGGTADAVMYGVGLLATAGVTWKVMAIANKTLNAAVDQDEKKAA
mmetsp:Transcript_4736/g.5497  ORF Transcript_4736/g.5497 Transcript_4736/m.5497 type:complete len:206 (-) Transcript_4736:1193-1810(-)|eukprot:CAMPEP_0204877464 /NCGR_PEP_ID=MMETSP1348-20121228/48203_1 /ASSEMBLY_ACC=CAM_ASM_000700 /TAXON_ID=215587 /ORGANISM="Aplanochytrium stocchinoi, Strain GSBS06" /LENGTH=205 /DNA_ID=CAMNT_0052034329 /DNA_START=237 /DNA_END=854 /DNA_ORIENTATION=-